MHKPLQDLPAKTPAESETTMVEVVYPNDANPMGRLHGGKLVMWMDTAAAICAQSHAEQLAATVSIDKMVFKKPAGVGDIVTIKAKMTRAFETSMEIFVYSMARPITGKTTWLINEAYFTFVALHEDGTPAPVPPLQPTTEAEGAAYEQALLRRNNRKQILKQS